MNDRSVSIPQSPLVVGSVDQLDQLTCLQPDGLSGLCDLLEVRLDGMSAHMDMLEAELDRFEGIPLLFTARGSAEGGLVELSAKARADLLLAVCRRASWIDVELASFADMADAIDQIRGEGVGLILSYHNFQETPTEQDMQNLVNLSEEADIVKLALHHNQVEDLVRCTRILQENDRPMSVMGMGPLGPVSRLLYAQHGSLLNYGYLGDQATAPGQWPAKLLKEAIAAVESID